MFELPARSMDADYLGITGARYSGHASTPPAWTRVRAVTFRDDVLAVVSLGDGREIEVYARGTIVSNATEGLRAAVTIDLDDDEAVSLTEEEIRERLFLRPEGIKWVCHWDDAQLLQQAELAAQAHASEWLDGDSLVDVPPEWRRESALHIAVKQIIEAELCMTLPSLSASATKRRATFSTHRDWEEPAKVVRFTSVRLEQRLGRVIPDVVASINDHALLIEVIISHPLSDLKREVLRELGLPVLEIDLRRHAGVVTREQLRTIVINGLDCKRWHFHPRIERMQSQLEKQVSDEIAQQSLARVQQSATERYSKATDCSSDQFRLYPTTASRKDSLFLAGAELDAWKRQHPERYRQLLAEGFFEANAPNTRSPTREDGDEE